MFTIKPQRPADAGRIESLLDRAFGPDRLTKASYQFRDGVEDVPDLRFVAVADGTLAGTIRFWPVVVGRTATPALLLGPLGVHPDYQGRGVGAALMDHGLHAARAKGHGIVVLVGELTYYGRFGFAPAAPRHITIKGEQDHRILVRELANDALEGVSGPVAPLAGRMAATDAA